MRNRIFRGSSAVLCALLLMTTMMTSTFFGQAPPSDKGIKPPTAASANPPAPKMAAGNAARPAALQSVLQPNRSPLVTFRILFNTGSASDPEGKEGVAALTASLIAGGGTRTMTYDQIVEAMYPMATGFGSQVDKEMTVFTGTTHVDNLDKYYSIISQMLLDPGFREEDFSRIKTDHINYLQVSLRGGNDEELGKEALYNMIYEGLPYGHNNTGSTSSLEKLTLNDVRDFYQKHYTQANLVIGMAGGYPAGFAKKVEADFGKLPVGQSDLKKYAAPKLEAGMKIQIIQRPTRSTAISLGFPIELTRADKDYPALAVVASYFGQHRSSNSYLYHRLRELRGLNYGDYAYIEYFPRGMFQFQPDANLGRQLQIFQIWIRPVPPEQGLFTLRAALYEYDKLVREGMSKEAFEGTRDFLMKYNNILTSTQDAQLGYALDSRYYGIPDFNTYMRDKLSKLTLEDVNRAIQTYLKSERMRVVLVTKDADALRDAILSGKPSPITYNSAKSQEIMDEDKVIESYRINVQADDVMVVPVDKVFQ
ncbi:MAG: insulinase family protein [Acidobacteria bacterium]|nr:insulinase family protein [Acidobacteriota bacterium]